MENKLFFSVIIPTYNRASFIEKTIYSVLNQTYPNFELIIIDDGSTDNTEDIVKSILDNRIRYYKTENGERAKARNFGAKVSKGDYVNFLDSDDMLLLNHLEEALKLISIHESAEIFHLNFDIRDEDEKILLKPKILNGDLNLQLVKKGNLLSSNGVFIRKDIAVLYPFNEDRALSASEDYELWLRLAARYKIYYSNTITSSILHHDLRSVLNFDKDVLIERLNLFIKYVFNDNIFSTMFGRYKSLMIAHTYSYIALHISLTGKNKFTSLHYLIKAFGTNYSVVYSKRFYAVIIKILTKF